MHGPHITIVSPNMQDTDKNNILEIISELGAELKTVKTITELYPLLSDQQFTTNLICINLETLYEKGEIEAWNSINALATIIKSTVSRPSGKGLPHKREVSIVACANVKSNIKHIKDFLKINDMCIGVFPKEFSKDDQRHAANLFIHGTYYVPEFFKQKFKSYNTIDVNPDKLTPRQQQIFELIVNRGASNKAIARILNISESTVKLHMTAILKKNSVRSRTQLAVFSKKHEPL
jgi:DNA-binding CsgD family transcriptional regulator